MTQVMTGQVTQKEMDESGPPAIPGVLGPRNASLFMSMAHPENIICIASALRVSV